LWLHPLRRDGRQIGFATAIISKTGQRHCLADEPITNLGEVAAIPVVKRQITGITVAPSTAFTRRLTFLVALTAGVFREISQHPLPPGNVVSGKQLLADEESVQILADGYA